MSISECYSCNLCSNGKCDKCETVCLNNMESHREIYKLIKGFDDKIYQALQNIYDRCIRIKNNLYDNYGINIELSNVFDKIVFTEDFLNKLKLKREEIEKYIYKIENEKSIIKLKKEDEINRLNYMYLNEQEDTRINYEKEKIKYNINDSKYDEVIKSKKQEISDLENEKNNFNINIEEIINNYIDEERKKLLKEFDTNIIEIDNKYNYAEKEFKYTEEEVELKNKYLNDIRKIKNYNNKIPNFENWIMAFNLNKFLN